MGGQPGLQNEFHSGQTQSYRETLSQKNNNKKVLMKWEYNQHNYSWNPLPSADQHVYTPDLVNPPPGTMRKKRATVSIVALS